MGEETPLDELRHRIGVEAALTSIVARPEVARRLRPVIERVLTSLGGTHRLHDMADLAAYGPFEFSRTFRNAAGMNYYEFVDRARVDGALLQLAMTRDSSEKVARAFGFMGVPTLDLSIGEYTGLPLAAVLSLLRP